VTPGTGSSSSLGASCRSDCEIGREVPLSESWYKASGMGGTGIEFRVPYSEVKVFTSELRLGTNTIIAFPNGSEAPWSGGYLAVMQ